MNVFVVMPRIAPVGGKAILMSAAELIPAIEKQGFKVLNRGWYLSTRGQTQARDEAASVTADREWLRHANFVIADVSVQSTEIGYYIRDAVWYSHPTIVACHSDCGPVPGVLTSGSQVSVMMYQDPGTSIKEIITVLRWVEDRRQKGE